MSYLNSEAIVLYKRTLWEADRLYVLYTENYGKIEARVKSAVRSRSKLAGSLEPVSLADVMIVRGKNMETIAGVQLKKRFSLPDYALQKDFDLVRELFIRFIKPEVHEPQLYQNLKNLLFFLEEDNSLKLKKFVIQRFIWQMVSILGHRPLVKKFSNELYQACLDDQLKNLQIKDNMLQELEKHTKGFLQNLLEGELRSLSFN